MTPLKREHVKYLRDFIKKDYIKGDECYICGVIKNLELHHLYSLSQVFQEWLDEQSISKDSIVSVEQINELRADFQQSKKEKLDNTYLLTLCSDHHKRLHNIYGQKYDNHQVPKILRWINIQRERHNN